MPEKKKYSHSDFMPKDDSHEEPVVEEKVTIEIIEPVEEPSTENIDPEMGVAVNTTPPGWAKFVSAFFFPLLIPTYTTALAMWITPLSAIDENKRLIVTFMILLITALAPLSYMLAMHRISRIKSPDAVSRPQRAIASTVFLICEFIGAYYLFSVKAPEWLIMFLIAGAGVTLVYLLLNIFSNTSGHMTGMGALTGSMIYLCKAELADVEMTSWIIAFIILSGLLGSARVAMSSKSYKNIVIGFIVGLFIAYIILNIPLLDPFVENIN